MALELIRHTDLGDGWKEVQCALDGTLAVPFSYHKSMLEGMDDQGFQDFLTRSARAMLEQFGDARQWPEQGRREVELQKEN